MRVLLAILLPFTAFFRLHRTGAGIASLLLQLTVVGWLPAALWAMYALGQASASQLQFIEEIVQHLTEHGAMPAARLYESPFTDIHAQGPDGVFDGNKVEQLFQALQGLELQQAAA